MNGDSLASGSKLTVNPGLFRLILAMFVVASHFSPIQLGSAAVYLFFALSGYWIQQMWGREYAVTDAPYLNFILSRLWRLLPAYYVSVALWLLVKAIFRVPRLGIPAVHGSAAVHFYLSHIFLLGYATLPYEDKIFAQMWSIDIELQFYFIAPLLISLLSRVSWRSWQMATLFGISAAGIVAFALFYNGVAGFRPQSAWLPMFLAFFLIGLCSARHNWQPSTRLSISCLVIACGFVAVCLLLPNTRDLLSTHKEHAPGLPEYNAIANMFIAFLVIPYAMATVRKPLNKSALSGSFDRVLGDLSYEVYCLHIIVYSIVLHYSGNMTRFARVPYLACGIAAILPLSVLVYHFIDRPINSARVAWVRSRRCADSAPIVVESERSTPVIAEQAT